MQLPYRKPPNISEFQQDPLITEEKFLELQDKLARLYASRPAVADDVHRLAQNGDFSENAEYQQAKGKLRGINHSILKLEHQIDHAVLIKKGGADKVSIGHTVTVAIGPAERTYQILGSAETNPDKGIISYTSPIGAALIGRSVGDTVEVALADRKISYKILKIS